MADKNIERLAEYGEEVLRKEIEDYLEMAQAVFREYDFDSKHPAKEGQNFTKESVLEVISKAKKRCTQLNSYNVQTPEYDSKIKNIEEKLI